MDGIHNRTDPVNDGFGVSHERITLRRLVLSGFAAAAGGVVWHRTGGDPWLSCAAPPFVFAALNGWVRDDSPTFPRGTT